jgi:hypothetical protein
VRRTISAGALICIVIAAVTIASSLAANAKVASSVPRELRTQILNTLRSVNLRVRDAYGSTVQSWDYQSPDRSESIPRRFAVAGNDYGFEIDVGNNVVYRFSIGQLEPPIGVKVTGNREFVGLSISSGRGQWTNVQSYLFAPLIDALSGSRYVLSNDTYSFSTRSGIRGRVKVDGRRVLNAQITYFESSCSSKIRYHESESFNGMEHFAKVVLPPSSAIQFAKSGKVTHEKKTVCS